MYKVLSKIFLVIIIGLILVLVLTLKDQFYFKTSNEVESFEKLQSKFSSLYRNNERIILFVESHPFLVTLSDRKLRRVPDLQVYKLNNFVVFVRDDLAGVDLNDRVKSSDIDLYKWSENRLEFKTYFTGDQTFYIDFTESE